MGPYTGFGNVMFMILRVVFGTAVETKKIELNRHRLE